MRRIFYLLFFAMFSLPIAAAQMPTACELIEQALMVQVQQAGGGQMGMNLEMQIKIARAYRELARRGCLQNRAQFAIQYRAAIEVAWALLDIQHPMPVDEIQTDDNDVITDTRVLDRQRLAAQIREVERAPIGQSW
jgi:hypothetical protein